MNKFNLKKIFAVWPMDCTGNETIRWLLLSPEKNKQTSPCVLISAGEFKNGLLMLTTSGIPSEKQKMLSKCETVLKTIKCAEFDRTVTHAAILMMNIKVLWSLCLGFSMDVGYQSLTGWKPVCTAKHVNNHKSKGSWRSTEEQAQQRVAVAKAVWWRLLLLGETWNIS